METQEFIVIRTWLTTLISELRTEWMLASEDYMNDYHPALGRSEPELRCLLHGLDDILLGLTMEYAYTGGSQDDIDDFLLLAEPDMKYRLLSLTHHRIWLPDDGPIEPVSEEYQQDHQGEQCLSTS